MLDSLEFSTTHYTNQLVSFTLEYIIMIVFGAAFGSFSTMFAYRLPRGEMPFGKYFGKKSSCTKCGVILRTRDLLPCLNFLINRGKCFSCHSKINPVYVFIECAMVVLFVSMYLIFGMGEELILYCMLCVLLVILSVTASQSKMFPDQILIIFAVLGVIYKAVIINCGISDLIFTGGLAILFGIAFWKIYNFFKLMELGDIVSSTKFIMASALWFKFWEMVEFFVLILAISFGIRKFFNSDLSRNFHFPLIFLVFFIALT